MAFEFPKSSVLFENKAENANYSIAYYVEEYVERLGIEGAGRLLTYTEANTLTQVQRTNDAHYWLGSASSSNLVRDVPPGGSIILSTTFFTFPSNGVRPVIIINTSDIPS